LTHPFKPTKLDKLFEANAMTSKIFGAVLLIVLGGLGGFVLASNPQVAAYLHWQQPPPQPVKVQPSEIQQANIDPETKYRLQERCADQAKKFFEEQKAPRAIELNSAQNKLRILPTYESHYNIRLNSCFVLVIERHFSADMKETYEPSLEVSNPVTLQDYAYYYGSSGCKVRGVTCNSQSEWWQLVKPYIEELASF
jgi:hypothetical protein